MWRTGLSPADRSEEHTSELQSLRHLVCRLLLGKTPPAAAGPRRHRPPRKRLVRALLRPGRGIASRRPQGEASSACRRREWSVTAFFFNDTATTEIYTLSLHDALPI